MSDPGKGKYLSPEWQRIYQHAVVQYLDKEYLGAKMSLMKIPSEFRGNPDVSELMRKLELKLKIPK